MPPRSGLIEEVAAAGTSATYKAAYFYTSDATTATRYESWLEANGFQVDLFSLQYTLYLPLIVKGSGGSAASLDDGIASLPVIQQSAVPDLSTYDLILIGPDTGAGGAWAGSSALTSAISETRRPVVALGEGGHAFLGRLGLEIGYPNGEETVARSVRVADRGQTVSIWDGTRPVTRAVEVAELYREDVNAIVVPLPQRLPDGVRVASLPGDITRFPIAMQAERFILWGFGGSPDDLTQAGRNLFLNLLDFGADDVVVPLRARQFRPSQGVEQSFADALGSATGPLHAIVQLRRPIRPADRAMLEAKGVTLVSYLYGLSYLATVDETTDLGDPELLALVRWIGEYRPTDRLHPDVASGNLAGFNISANGTVTLTVLFFPEVSGTEAQAVLAAHGATIIGQMALNGWVVTMDQTQITSLSQEEAVRWIEQGPVPNQDINDGARTAMGTDTVVDWDTATGTALGLDGSGVRVAVMEGGVDYRHDDFGGRFVYTYTNTYSDHATHVAGIIGGDGSRSAALGGTAYEWRGHAPGVTLLSVSYGKATVERYNTAINTYGAHLSNHSYVMSYGLYDAVAAGVDSIVRGDATYSGNAIPPRLAVWAAANQGWQAQYDDEEGFFSIYSPAKNVLTVGSTDSDSNDISFFSSRGPTFDNRIKPDVVAPGCEALGGADKIRSTSATNFNGYTNKCGTSMAAPAAVGALALALEAYFDGYNTTTLPRPSTLKGLAIHTATDLQRDFATGGQAWNDPDLCGAVQAPTTPISATCAVLYHAGPDYSTGYGLINVPALVEQVEHKGFVEGTVYPTDTVDVYTVTVLENRTEIKFTLVWDDEPGDTSTAETASKLVNDLDLTLIAPDGTVYHPWILDPLTPNANPGSGGFDNVTRADITPAYRGVDRRNNVEQVSVTDTVGVMTGTWTVRVSAFNLPNGNPQPYSLIGDFRQVEILDPVFGNAVNAGDHTDPGKIWVRVRVINPLANPSHTSGLETSDFEVKIGGLTANIVSGLQVQDQFWMIVQAPAQPTAAYYDLEVTLVGRSRDREHNAVYYLDPGAQVDTMVVGDTSGSMSYCEKIDSAQNAGRLFVDHANTDDMIGVASFDSSSSLDFELVTVTSTTTLDNAKAAIDAWTAGGMTALGQGVLEGYNELSNDGDVSDEWRIALLSDGMENIEPYWSDASVSGVVIPSQVVVDVVALGHDADTGLLSTIAAATGGDYYHAAIDCSAGVSAMAYTSTLPNRLADIYKTMAEDARLEQRVGNWQGSFPDQQMSAVYTLTLESGLPEVLFAVNWNVVGGDVGLLLNGKRCAALGGEEIYDKTHRQCRVPTPTPGVWTVRLENYKTPVQYHLMVSARSDVVLLLFVGDPGAVYAQGDSVPIRAFVGDSKPIPSATVQVQVKGPSKATEQWLLLYDDGQHGDGEAGDGFYGNVYSLTLEGGPYDLSAEATGVDNNGVSFQRSRIGSFYVHPRLVYIYGTDEATARDYEELLDRRGLPTDLMRMDAITISTSFASYSLLIIGSDTASGGTTWGTSEQFSAVAQAGKPILGLGRGGSTLFEAMGLAIGWMNSWVGLDRSYVRAVDPTLPIYTSPYSVTLTGAEHQATLYDQPTDAIEVYLPDAPAGVTLLGRSQRSDNHYPIVAQGDRSTPRHYTLWGFEAGPSQMSADGLDAFVNTTWYALGPWGH